MNDWQPIETAPRDGTPILICKGDVPGGNVWGRVRCARWADCFWRLGFGYAQQDRDLLGWMPIPEPPEVPRDAKER